MDRYIFLFSVTYLPLYWHIICRICHFKSVIKPKWHSICKNNFNFLAQLWVSPVCDVVSYVSGFFRNFARWRFVPTWLCHSSEPNDKRSGEWWSLWKEISSGSNSKYVLNWHFWGFFFQSPCPSAWFSSQIHSTQQMICLRPIIGRVLYIDVQFRPWSRLGHVRRTLFVLG